MRQRLNAIGLTLALVAIVGTIAVCVYFVDRPLAELLRPNFAGVPFFVWLTYPANPLTSIAAIFLIVTFVRTVMRGGLTENENTLLRGACAILIAWAFTYILKEICGRTWPETWVDNNPSYFKTGTYGFFPLTGGIKYAAFPSGHMTIISTLAAALWFSWRRLRWLGVAAAFAVAIGLLGANYHWLSDIIAGAFIGGVTAFAAMRIFFTGQSPVP